MPSGAEVITKLEFEAAVLDDGQIGSFYVSDEATVELYDGVYHSAERREWLARFTPTNPDQTKLAHSDATYLEVLEFARFLHDCRIKPSQSFKALAAFDTVIDREAVKLFFRPVLKLQTPEP